MTTEKRNELTGEAKRRDRQVREERIDRAFEELHELFRKNKVIFDRWRAEGILPPEEPHRRF
jgi:hypothetical protein